jgi:hypothetical protein
MMALWGILLRKLSAFIDLRFEIAKKKQLETLKTQSSPPNIAP